MNEAIEFDVVINGGGIVGISLAVLLAKNDFSVAVIEAKAPVDLKGDLFLRVSAINHGTAQLFTNIDVWNDLSSRVCPMHHMSVRDNKNAVNIEFDRNDVDTDELGFIASNDEMLQALLKKVEHFPKLKKYCPVSIESIETNTENLQIKLNDGELLTTKLLVGADGANSFVRDYFNIPLKKEPYCHIAMVAILSHEQPHHNTASQVFLTTGPLAFLPLPDQHQSSMVWSCEPEFLQRLDKLSPEDMAKQIEKHFNSKYGEIRFVSSVKKFPLYRRHVKQYIRERVVLVGDAAHTIHPLAGQGLNLGLRDVKELVNLLIVNNPTQKNSCGNVALLRKYERSRKADVSQVLLAMDGFKTIFGSSFDGVVALRGFGLSVTNRLPFLKKFFLRKAMGV